MTKDHQRRLSDVYERVYASEKTVKLLKSAGRVSVIITVAIFLALICFALTVGVIEAAKLLALAGAPFIIVSALRMVMKSERPYELIDFSDFSGEPPHRKSGASFPSRHVFSAFLIALLAFEYAWYLGAVAIFAGVVLAISRVLLGIHFAKDVVCGAIIGVISGVIGILIL